MFFEHLKQHFFSYSVILLLLLAIGSSYMRFVVLHDYTIYDEVECDPSTHSCYLYCEDEECSEPFYYAELTRYAADYVTYCDGIDYWDCDASYSCMPDETTCQVQYCDNTDPANDCHYFTSEVNENIE